jgi:hypothetical protein
MESSIEVVAPWIHGRKNQPGGEKAQLLLTSGFKGRSDHQTIHLVASRKRKAE